ncbi:activator of 90 kDa heat shock protein ATPase homolog 2-like isoform X1 [Nycticebus coucang]|uniref:activator of 90 kDa heat shock protein ATPase homolog 2-like isoform X1 n=1 Tax=Nycticebus coucang TaxID=9470 RepID=UPI00234D0A40|nr:activator of 90 kDa heat shock protein ATPase homolog 2-like isoform X1 [Nycticebus coucang]
MAKWGQGDPRWIVEEREYGTNVNNWHWTERDATTWSKGKLQELLVGIAVENEAGCCEISELKQVEGIIKESGVKHRGLIEIPNLSEENEVDDYEVNVSKKKGDGDILKHLMKTAGTAKAREAVGDYLKALKTEFTMGMILPTKGMANQELTVKRKLIEPTSQVQASSLLALGVRIPTVALYMMELFDTTVEQLYSIFTVKDVNNSLHWYPKC